MTSHSCDCGACDFRYVYVPAADYEPGAKRAIYPFLEGYPRYVGKDMGPTHDDPNYPPTEPLGYIDQVEHTYGYFDAVYGVINEHQLAIAPTIILFLLFSRQFITGMTQGAIK